MQRLNREQLLFVYRIDRLSSLHKKKKDRSVQLKQEQNLSPTAQPAIRAKEKKKKEQHTSQQTSNNSTKIITRSQPPLLGRICDGSAIPDARHGDETGRA